MNKSSRNQIPIIGVLLFIIINFDIYCQIENFPKGIYMSFEEIKNKNPSKSNSLIVMKRTQFDIKMNGGNDFKLESENKEISASNLKNEVFGYSNGGTLFLNCHHYDAQKWYSNVISSGNYFLLFKAGLSSNPNEQEKQRDLMSIGSFLGAVGGGIQGARLATLRFLYIVILKSNKVFTITTERMEKLLQVNAPLLEKFKNEPSKDDEATQIKYLKLLNEPNSH